MAAQSLLRRLPRVPEAVAETDATWSFLHGRVSVVVHVREELFPKENVLRVGCDVFAPRGETSRSTAALFERLADVPTEPREPRVCRGCRGRRA